MLNSLFADNSELAQNFRDFREKHLGDQQKRVLDKLVDKQYNKVHEDAFAKICGLEEKGKRSWNSRARDLIGGLWFERAHLKLIMKIQDFEYAKLLKENQELRAEIEKIRNTKGEYGQA